MRLFDTLTKTKVEVDVVARHSQLLEVRAHRLGGDARVAQRSHRRSLRPLGELLAVRAQHQAVMDVFGWGGGELLMKSAVQGLVRTMVGAADHVRDAEVDVVDDARQVIRGAAVFPKQRDPIEALTEGG